MVLMLYTQVGESELESLHDALHFSSNALLEAFGNAKTAAVCKYADVVLLTLF